jgi:hypothetical protein
MMNKNSENPRVGKEFQLAVKEWFEEAYTSPFEIERKIAIGRPAKLHSFDISSLDESIVVECKCYTWTETGNIPSAKMGFTNEAAFYLSFLPDDTERIIVMLHAEHLKRNETLAEYYFRTNRHLLGKIKIYEFDLQTKEMRFVGQNED